MKERTSVPLIIRQMAPSSYLSGTRNDFPNIQVPKGAISEQQQQQQQNATKALRWPLHFHLILRLLQHGRKQARRSFERSHWRLLGIIFQARTVIPSVQMLIKTAEMLIGPRSRTWRVDPTHRRGGARARDAVWKQMSRLFGALPPL